MPDSKELNAARVGISQINGLPVKLSRVMRVVERRPFLRCESIQTVRFRNYWLEIISPRPRPERPTGHAHKKRFCGRGLEYSTRHALPGWFGDAVSRTEWSGNNQRVNRDRNGSPGKPGERSSSYTRPHKRR